MDPLPKVSIVIPCLNEGNYIALCLNSLLENSYPKHKLEILVIDGGSVDQTTNIVKGYAEKYPSVRLFHNPKRLTPSALNIGIRNSSGTIIIRMDAHTACSPNYIQDCAEALIQFKADNVGGIVQTCPGDRSILAQAIALALCHPFGVGSSRFRTAKKSDQPQEVDTVPFGCFHRKLFDRIGYFDEALPQWKGRCNEDFDFNQRIRKAGGKIILLPKIESHYFARTSIGDFIRHSFNNGVLVTLPLGSNNGDFSLRHLVPVLFVMAICAAIPIFLKIPLSRPFLLLLFGMYGGLSLYFSFTRALVKKDFRFFFAMPFIFLCLHLSYGLGSLFGMFKAVRIKTKRTLSI